MGEALDRPWLSKFDKEYYEFEDNRKRYQYIYPDHGNELWEISCPCNGQRLRKYVKTLDAALDAIHQFRQSAGRG